MRVKGSCKFSTYYRLQAWNENLFAWQPVKVVETQEQARKAMKAGKRYRIWEISMDADPLLVHEA